MNIGVQSFPELYTTLMGWHLYDQLWDLITQTGLAFLPFLGMLLKNIAEPYASQETKDAASTSLRRMELNTLGMLSLIFFVVSPILQLTPSVLSYTPVCQLQGQHDTYHPGDTNTTWDKAFSIPTEEVKVPLWWAAVISVSEGFASAANTMVSCVPDLRKMVTQVNTAQITDPTLKQELQQFETNCYIPARTQYLQDSHINSDNINNINEQRKKYGDDDTEWFGSHGFQNTYYQNLKAQDQVKGFAYNQNDDINADIHKDNPPAYGNPNCNDWWNDADHGLKTRLYSALPKTFSDEFQDFFKTDDKSILKDNVIKKIITNADTGYQPATDTGNNYIYSHVVTAIGSEISQLSTYPKIYAALQASPIIQIIQALILLMIYTFLPFALVFTSYRLSAFITGGIIIFSVIFWSFIWHLVSFADTTLMQALYTDSWFSQHAPAAVIADMITASLILIAPLFWFSFMGAMGVAVGEVMLRTIGGMNSPADSAASAGSSLVRTAASSAISAGMPIANAAIKTVSSNISKPSNNTYSYL
jgi:hypothetical protein